MRSNELAKLAGVTVRTLRHYHQIGLLNEPERSSNGYRRYTVQHLATVLRIGSFTALGVPLNEVHRVLNDHTAAVELLDRLDRDAAAEMGRLAVRRASIARFKEGGVAPDLPAALIRFAPLLTARSPQSKRDLQFEREQLALIEHLSDDTELTWLVTTFDNFAHSSDRYHTISRDFSNLSEKSTTEQMTRLAVDIVELITSSVPLKTMPSFDTGSVDLLLTHQYTHYNKYQRLVWTRVLEILTGRT